MSAPWPDASVPLDVAMSDLAAAENPLADWAAKTTLVLPPHEVLARHTDLMERMKRPGHYLQRFFRSFAADVLEKDPERAHLMFYPWEVHEPEGARYFVNAMYRQLLTARTVQVSADICALLADAHSNSRAGVEHVSEYELPSETGFVWLDTPLAHHDKHGKIASIRAITWGPQAVRYEQGDGEKMYPAVRLTFWTYHLDEDDYKPAMAESLDYSDAGSQVRQDLGDLTMCHTIVLPFETRMESDAPGADTLLGFLHSLWMFMGMEIVAKSKAKLDRPARRRGQKAFGREPEVNVIMLRRIRPQAPEDHEPGHAFVDWSCRWIVQGHHRHIEAYAGSQHHAIPGQGATCAICGGKITWVRPYIKGPDGRPLKTAEQLYKVAR